MHGALDAPLPLGVSVHHGACVLLAHHHAADARHAAPAADIKASHGGRVVDPQPLADQADAGHVVQVHLWWGMGMGGGGM